MLSPYDGTKFPALVGKEYVSEVVTAAPDARIWTGAGHTELFLDGPFPPTDSDVHDRRD